MISVTGCNIHTLWFEVVKSLPCRAEAHDGLAGVVGIQAARGAARTDVGGADAAHKGAVQIGKGAVAVRPQHGFCKNMRDAYAYACY